MRIACTNIVTTERIFPIVSLRVLTRFFCIYLSASSVLFLSAFVIRLIILVLASTLEFLTGNGVGTLTFSLIFFFVFDMLPVGNFIGLIFIFISTTPEAEQAICRLLKLASFFLSAYGFLGIISWDHRYTGLRTGKGMK